MKRLWSISVSKEDPVSHVTFVRHPLIFVNINLGVLQLKTFHHLRRLKWLGALLICLHHNVSWKFNVSYIRVPWHRRAHKSRLMGPPGESLIIFLGRYHTNAWCVLEPFHARMGHIPRWPLLGSFHDDVIRWKHFPCYWPFVRGIHRSPVNSPHKGQWRGALMLSLICALNKRLSGLSWGWGFETPSRSLWRHCNEVSEW